MQVVYRGDAKRADRCQCPRGSIRPRAGTSSGRVRGRPRTSTSGALSPVLTLKGIASKEAGRQSSADRPIVEFEPSMDIHIQMRPRRKQNKRATVTVESVGAH
jgi:hypothetical protein